MAFLVGIDEAGYGPVLGPLVVTGVVFEMPDDAVCECLWQILQESVTKRIAKRDNRLPVIDSKKLYKSKTGLKSLERTALVMLSAAGHATDSVMELITHVAPHALGDLHEYPWYRNVDRRLPVANDPVDINIRANAVRRDMANQNVRLASVFSEPLPAGHFNRRVCSTRNKAVVSLGLVLRIIDRAIRSAGGQRVRVVVDRQGGRQRYRSALMTALAGYDLYIEEETPQRSAYRLEGGDGCGELTIEFLTNGEEHNLAVALGGILSKYVRELYMASLNRYWSDRVDQLQPTAGYYQDAQRYLAEINGAAQRERVDTSLLIRSR